MKLTVVVSDSVAKQFEEISSDSLESAGVLLVGVVSGSVTNMRLLAREYHPVSESSYLQRSPDALAIASEGYVPALARAEQMGAAPVWVHTHPGRGSSPLPSRHDYVVDAQLSETFRLRSGSNSYGALILSPADGGLRFSGHFAADEGNRYQINRMWRVGDRFRLTHDVGSETSDILNVFDRNVRAFGPAVQTALSNLSVGIVGCGGTGSAVAEQLVRLGVRTFVLIDPDTLSQSNLTRVYGSVAEDVGRPKVNVIAQHLQKIAPETTCEAVQSMVTHVSAAKKLLPCDIIFGCTDDNAGRLVLSRLATYLLTPVIDSGVLLSNNPDGELTGIDGRVTVVVPENACLMCRDRIDTSRAGAEMLTPDERRRLENEGYAPALGIIEPAVVTYVKRHQDLTP